MPKERDHLGGLPDDSLVERFKETSDDAYFAEIFVRYRAGISRCCIAMVRDRETAADLTQATFLQALKGFDSFSGGNLRGWLTTIAKHQCINWIRSMHRGPRALCDQDCPDERIDIAEDLLSSQTIQALLKPLSEEQRRCLQLFWLHGLTYEEIAALTRVEVGRVKSHIQNGMKRMRKAQVDTAGKK